MKMLLELACLLMILLLSGCYVHKGRLCSITMPQIYCDREAYKRVTSPTPLSHNWVKDGVTGERRASDWIECGGSDKGWYYPDSSPEDSIYDYQERSRVKHHDIQRCMLNKGYQYIGPCDTSIRKAWPGCIELEK